MYGNFTKVNLQQNGTRLQVDGWLNWSDGGDTAKLTIAVTQGNVTASTSQPVPVTNTDTTWRAIIDVPNGGRFQDGIVTSGQAGAVVTTGTAVSSQGWTSQPLSIN